MTELYRPSFIRRVNVESDDEDGFDVLNTIAPSSPQRSVSPDTSAELIESSPSVFTIDDEFEFFIHPVL
ncbi:hypothetical protein KM1_006570 [Entamoeba histolytica HM-3:IMSS]|uniref:Two tm domain protein n=2 Tax=Entamoeba histolytica TaxID=5759 RepID=A0A175JFT1_ENTHI|nr:hypothetical protein KM1_006570 [Entamoeba histolytica HM-3:IMSS]GAT92348.1 two tm domain protein [Entamoeba histolytica]